MAVIIIQVPALDARKDDIPLLVNHFAKIICNEYGKSVKKVTPDAMKILQDLSWTGNIRELRNVVERLIILSADEITADDVNTYVTPAIMKNEMLLDLFDKVDSEDDLKEMVVKKYRAYREE